MNRKTAAVLFLAVCVILAMLLFMQAIPPLTSGIIFAVALVLFGLFSRGFKK